MWLNINPSSGIPIFIQIKEQIKDSIAGGVFREGDKLPSVRELSKELTVNPNTVSKAYQELEQEGIVNKERGIGMFIAVSTEKQPGKVNENIFREKLEKLFTEAHHLNISETRMKELFMEALKAWSNRDEEVSP